MSNMIVSLGIVVAAFLGIAASLPPTFQIQNGFEYLGAAEGKVFVIPIKGPGTDNLTYQDAIAKCASAGYQIATLESQVQNDVVQPHVCSRWSWIDGVAFQNPDNFFSINTGKNLTYFNWVPQRPVIGDPDRICIRISCNSFEQGWWDLSCTESYHSVVCQTLV